MTNNTSIHQQVLALLDGPADYWDRPDCDWPDHASRRNRTDDEIALARQSANTAYVMGSLALERDNLDQARTWFAKACDERHPGAAFRLAVLGLRQIGGLPTASREAGVAGVLTALCRAAEWGHTDAHRLIDPFITRTGAHTGAIVATGTGTGTSIVTSLPAMTVVPNQPYAPQDPWFYDEVLTFCSNLPAVSATADSPQTAAQHVLPYKASTRETRLLKWATHSFAALEAPWRNMTDVEHELWLYLDSAPWQRWPRHDARPAGEHHIISSKLLQRFGMEPNDSVPSAQPPWVCQCIRCGEKSTPRLHTTWAEACRQHVRTRGWETYLGALLEMYEYGSSVGKPHHNEADSAAERADAVGDGQLVPGYASALNEGTELGTHAWADARVTTVQVAGSLRRHGVESAGDAVQNFWSFNTSCLAALGCSTQARYEAGASDRLPAALATPTPARGGNHARTAWAKLLYASTLLSAVAPCPAESAVHMVRDEATLYLFTATPSQTGNVSHQRLVTPITITALSADTPEPFDPTSELRSRTSEPTPPSTGTPDSIQVFALCP